jgi:hypothetical protein
MQEMCTAFQKSGRAGQWSNVAAKMVWLIEDWAFNKSADYQANISKSQEWGGMTHQDGPSIPRVYQLLTIRLVYVSIFNWTFASEANKTVWLSGVCRARARGRCRKTKSCVGMSWMHNSKRLL